MKKGFFALLFSFVLGCVFVFMYLMDNPVSFGMRNFGFFSRVYRLPDLRMSGFLILVILGLIANLFAMISNASSIAMGAAVFFGVSIAADPNHYPFALVQFLLCTLAAARMSVNRKEELGDLADQIDTKKRTEASRAVRYSDSADAAARRNAVGTTAVPASGSSSNAYQSRSIEEVQRALEGRTYTRSRTETYRPQSVEEVQRQLEGHGSSRRRSGIKAGVVCLIVIVAVIMGILLPVVLRSARNRSATQETAGSWKTDLQDLNVLITGSKGETKENGGDGGVKSDVQGTGGGNVSKDSSQGTSGDNGQNDVQGTGGDDVSKGSTQAADPADLTGTWTTKQRSGTYMTAAIEEDSIVINWVTQDGQESLYWKGSFKPVGDSEQSDTWLSMLNISSLMDAPFASRESSKFFYYRKEDDSITFSAEISGLKMKVTLYRDSDL